MNTSIRLSPLVLSLSLISAAHAQGSVQDYDIPAQSTAQVLRAIAQHAGLQLSLPDEPAAAAPSNGLRGRFTPEQALTRALAGSGLVLRGIDGGVARISTAGSLQQVTVTATRTPRLADEVPASVNVLSAEHLATKHRQNVYDALRDLEGLDFGYAGSVPQQVVPTMRGVGASFAGQTTQALVDGLPMDSPVSNVLGRGGLNFTPLFDVERVEVVRGPGSVLYGPGVIGGAINVIPKRWRGAPGAEFALSYGSHDTRSASLAAGLEGSDHDLRLSATSVRSDGFIAIPVPDAFGQVDIAARDWTDTKAGLNGGWRPAAGQELRVSAQHYATRGASLGGRPNARHNLDGDMLTLGYQIELSPDTTLRAQLRGAQLKQRYSFDEQDWNGDMGNLALAYIGGRTSRTTAMHLQADLHPTHGHQLSVGASWEQGDHESWGEPVGGTRSVSGAGSTVQALFVQDELRLDALVLSGGLRWDRLHFDADTVNGAPKNGSASTDDVVTPRLGARYHFSPATSVYVSAGTAYLPATNSFKYVQPSTTRVDNPDLKPETSTSYEIGLNHRFDGGAVRLAVYRTRYRDQITLGTDAVSGKRQWQNIALVKAQGVEMAYEGRLAGGWQPYANASYTQAQDFATSGSPAEDATRVSARHVNAGLGWAPGGAWSATLNWRATSGRYFNGVTPDQWGAGFGVADAKLRWQWLAMGRGWELFAAVNNLGGKRYSEWNVGEYADGRHWTLGLSGRL